MQPRESKKDRRKCMLRNCNHTREFYEPNRKLGICSKCKLIYFNKKDLKKIHLIYNCLFHNISNLINNILI